MNNSIFNLLHDISSTDTEYLNYKYKDKVIVICPTYNRRSFLPILLYQFAYQTYPAELLKLIILDDSEKSNDDIINSVDQELRERIIYIYSNEKKTIGTKRNVLNNLALAYGAEYIVCFDDDDFYPPERVAYAVYKLKSTDYLIGGSSTLLIYEPDIDKVYRIGPYLNKIFMGHATNGTLVYNKKYLESNSYNDADTKAEEKCFLRGFKVPLIQLAYDKVMVCMSHNNNTVDKKRILKFASELKEDLDYYIKDHELLSFFKNIKKHALD
jgi:hypothetical protein